MPIRLESAYTRGRTDHFSSISVDREFSSGRYLFTVSNSGLLFSYGAAAGFQHFTLLLNQTTASIVELFIL